MQRIKLTNSYDEDAVTRGHLGAEQVRTTEIEALVDTGATMMVLPADAVSHLGLLPAGHRKVRYVAEVPWVGGTGS